MKRTVSRDELRHVTLPEENCVRRTNMPIKVQDRPIIRIAAASIVLLLMASRGYADIVSASATVRPNNSLIVDIQVTTAGSAAKVVVTYQTAGVDPLVSRLTPVSSTGPTMITIGRLRA